MSKYKDLKVKFDKLVKALGFADYGDSFIFYDLIDGDAGTLQRISANKDKQIESLREELNLIKSHLGIDVVYVKPGFKVIKIKKERK